MQVIGVTGGVGAGKSAILEYLEENYKVKILVADRIAQMLMDPDTECYQKLMKFLPVEVYHEDETINRVALADKIFKSEELRHRVNRVVHPAVKEYILDQIEEQREMGVLDFVVIEGALLIEDHYDKICDELWYVYATEELRRKRLMRARGYSREKIERMFASQLTDRMYRKSCRVVIDNNGTREETFYQVAQIIKNKGKSSRGKQRLNDVPLVFGLDIGTRNVVGTVGYREEDDFYVLAQFMREHETRSMLDGQIHDIGRVGRTVNAVKTALEEQLDMTLEEVCIAAAGRVLKTISTNIEYVLPEEGIVTEDDVHTLNLLGIEKAQQILNDSNETNLKFYCVGHSMVKYYLNGDPFSSLEGHKAKAIGEDIIVTFLPEDVVEGLYSAVELAGLKVASLTLEPIAAISVAIPEAFRMLNIALVDVGAGTSDISITKDGSIIAYGMIPSAGDEITEMLVQQFLVDFKTAEHIKVSSTTEQEIEYQDIMMIRHTVTAEEVWELMKPLVEKLAEEVASKIKELNGGPTVSATFVVGGGGKVHGFIERLAAELELPKERVALRGEEVLQDIYFEQPEIKKDPLLVTPIGICLSYYHQKNNFIFVWLNGDRIKLYDNDKLTVLDAAVQAGFTNEQLFPGKGKELHFTVNGKRRTVGGEPIAAAVVQVNGEECSLNDPLVPNSEIALTVAPLEDSFVCHIADLEEYEESGLTFFVNGESVACPKYVEAGGDIVTAQYEIQENDKIKIHSFYTVAQLLTFLEIEAEAVEGIQVNGKRAELDTPLYGNFFVEWKRKDRLPEPQGSEPFDEKERPGEDEFPEKAGRFKEGEIPDRKGRSEGNWGSEGNGRFRGDGAQEGRGGYQADEAFEGRADFRRNKVSEAGGGLRGDGTAEGRGSLREDGTAEGRSSFREDGTAEGRGGFRGDGGLRERGSFGGNETSEGKGSFRGDGVLKERGSFGGNKTAEGKGNFRGNEVPEEWGSFGGNETAEGKGGFRGDGVSKERGSSGGNKTAEGKGNFRGNEVPEGRGSFRGNEVPEGRGSFRGDGVPDGRGSFQGNEASEERGIFGGDEASAGRTALSQPAPGTASSRPSSGKGREGSSLQVTVNGEPVTLTGKTSYIFVDVFDAVGFNLNEGNGRSVVMQLNGKEPAYTAPLHSGDTIEIYWEG